MAWLDIVPALYCSYRPGWTFDYIPSRYLRAERRSSIESMLCNLNACCPRLETDASPRLLSTKTTMECSFALTGKDYVLVAADTTAARSIVKMKVDEDKIKTLSPHLLMAYSGESGMSTR